MRFRHPRARALSLLTALLLLPACAGPRLQAIGEPPPPAVVLSEGGISLTLLPNTWKAYPSSLPRHYTPLEVRIENARSDEILVRYGDVLVVDEAGNQYRAVAPAEVAAALFGALPPASPAPAALAEARMYASSWPWWPYRGYGWRHPFYGPYYPWADPWWDYPYYPRPRPTPYDVLSLGLREGRVLPGAKVEGFLYLQHATARGNLLTLTWTPVTADSRPLPPLRAQFRVVR
ncbi:MAG: hypothetical protein ACE147_21565 [Candidatus Methylomirabilales bacterium]